MHESNIRLNMGDYNNYNNDYHPKPKKNHLNMLLEESAYSHLSNSEAFERPKGPQNNLMPVRREEARGQRH